MNRIKREELCPDLQKVFDQSETFARDILNISRRDESEWEPNADTVARTGSYVQAQGRQVIPVEWQGAGRVSIPNVKSRILHCAKKQKEFETGQKP